MATSRRGALPRGASRAAVRLIRPFGFIAEDGGEHYWREGQRVGNSTEVNLLEDRGAPIEYVSCQDL